MKPLKNISTNFEQNGHRILLASLLLVIIANPFMQQNVNLRQLLAIFMMLMLLAAVRTVAGQPRQFRIALILGVFALLGQFGVFVMRIEWLEVLKFSSMTLLLFWVCALLLRDIILRSHSVSLELILGAINIYLMVGVGFAATYALLELIQPGSFTGLEATLNTPTMVHPFMYFSFVTLTTLGYGDISPLTPVGEMLSYVEAIFGQLYLAILVARLVGLYIAKPRDAGEDS
jgi:hypothetical protein